MSADVNYLATELAILCKQDCQLNLESVIRNKIHDLVDPKEEALRAAWHDLLDAAGGYYPYRWNHELNPFCETLVMIGAALKLPSWKVWPEDVDPMCHEFTEPPLCPQPQRPSAVPKS